MVTMCEGKAGFALAQLVLGFCEHWHTSPEAGSAQGTFPPVLGTFLAASHRPALHPVSTSASYSKPEPQKRRVYSS